MLLVQEGHRGHQTLLRGHFANLFAQDVRLPGENVQEGELPLVPEVTEVGCTFQCLSHPFGDPWLFRPRVPGLPNFGHDPLSADHTRKVNSGHCRLIFPQHGYVPPHAPFFTPDRNRSPMIHQLQASGEPQASGHSPLRWFGDKQIWHLCTRLTLPKQAPPGLTLAHELYRSQRKNRSLLHSGPSSWVFLSPCSRGCQVSFCFPPARYRFNSSLSFCHLAFFANLLSLLACLFLSPASPDSVGESCTPGKWALVTLSAGVDGEPFWPPAVQAMAGFLTCSVHHLSSCTSILKQHDHGAVASQSIGAGPPFQCPPGSSAWSCRASLHGLCHQFWRLSPIPEATARSVSRCASRRPVVLPGSLSPA